MIDIQRSTLCPNTDFIIKLTDQVAIRNFHDDPDHTESNDIWLRIVGSGTFDTTWNGFNVNRPNPLPGPTIDGGDWNKYFSNRVGEWNWMTVGDVHHE